MQCKPAILPALAIEGAEAMTPTSQPGTHRHFRTLFISDVHLGSKAAQAEQLLAFLAVHDAEKIYLVGDIVDGWRLKRAWHWPQSHNDVVQAFLRKARKGTQIVYIPGNHDEFLRGFPGQHFGGIEVRLTDVHETADGRKLLVMHGDEFDVVVRNARLIAYLGDWAYDAAIAINSCSTDSAAASASATGPSRLGEAEGEERGVLHRRLRDVARGGSRPDGLRGCRVRAYSPPADRGALGYPLRQQW